ncbi:WG repeat-containing protein [Bacteroidales bacterium OttesenSCG-928-K03]|nr:WG repeat-containing protein [Bacteroidales bacterium OttesenSCG-928-L14]MDL2240936.1 WG repeat-containing protein [Bacteroidales bacterium OttesenSCG-928-K22]MDL2243063.1 WG repeat-containing protein [Bacteroidales bacterium OttesenSCG-928-K03]
MKPIRIILFITLFFSSLFLTAQEITLTRFSENKKWGYKDNDGKIVIPANYDEVSVIFYDEMARVKLNNKWGFINKEGKEIIPIIYDNIGLTFYGGPVPAQKNGKWGYINRTSIEVIPFIYDYVNTMFFDGIAKVSFEGKVGYIDTLGNVIIPYIYDGGGISFSDEMVAVKHNNKWGVIDKSNKVLVPFNFDMIGSYSEGYFKVVQKGKIGYIDKTGKEIIPCIYVDGGDFKNGQVNVKVKDKKADAWITLDTNNNKASISTVIESDDIAVDYDKIYVYNNGLARIYKNKGKYGFINKQNELIVPMIYDEAHDFSYGFARVKQDKKWGMIDTTGNLIIPIIYDNIWDFHFELAKVQIGKKYGFVDKNGNEIFPVIYNYVDKFDYKHFQIGQNGKYGLLNTLEQTITIPIVCNYKIEEIREDGYLLVKKMVKKDECKYGLSDIQGNMIVPVRYDLIEDFIDETVIVKNITIKEHRIDVMRDTETTDLSSNYMVVWRKGGPVRNREIISEGLIDKTGKVIIPIKTGQNLYRHNDGTFEVYKATKAKGIYVTDYISTGKFYNKNGEIIKR